MRSTRNNFQKINIESPLHHFHNNPLYFTIIADFEADKETVNSSIVYKTTNKFQQTLIPMVNILYLNWTTFQKVGIMNFFLGYDNVVWFVNEILNLKVKMPLYLQNTNKDLIMTQKIRKTLVILMFVDFVIKEILSDKVRDDRHLTGKYRRPAHRKCNINLTREERNFFLFVFLNFSTYYFHLFLKNQVKFKIVPKTNKECISITYGCVRFIDKYRF